MSSNETTVRPTEIATDKTVSEALYKTVRYTADKAVSSDCFDLAVFDDVDPVKMIPLDGFKKERVTFGRIDDAGTMPDIGMRSPFVSRNIHAFFVRENGKWWIEDNNSTNGLEINGINKKKHQLQDNDMIRICDADGVDPRGVLILCIAKGHRGHWNEMDLSGDNVLIGREKGCDLCLTHQSVSNRHAAIRRKDGRYTINDLDSTNGVFVNGERVTKSRVLLEKDVITITTTRIIYSCGALFYCSFNDGISVEANDVVIVRKRGLGKKIVTGDHISLRVEPGELVSIIGGSGAGKSTLLNCMCGYLKPAKGNVLINGIDLYHHFDAVKRQIGYVPQADIVYDNLTLYETLMYTAKLRLPKDTSKTEYEQCIDRVIDTVDLKEQKHSLIKKLSGGQRKRASIAVELVSDPNLLFLDEPASGLDPGTERSLMQTLRKMADQGKTIILVTHSTLQLDMCDKVAFMGKGGRLCCYDPLPQALEFFNVRSVVDVYELLNTQSSKYQAAYNRYRQGSPTGTEVVKKRKKHIAGSYKYHFSVTCQRYLKLILNDRSRLLLLLLQAPLMTFLISLVANGKQYEEYEMTNNILFCLACCGFWVGMLNAIGEICKERTIMRREYMTGLSLTAYLVSKITVLGLICIVQSAEIVGVFALLVGIPENGLLMHPLPEMYITTLLIELSSAAMGLLVSAFVSKPDSANTLVPILLLPQLLFSGLIFKLEDAAEIISWFAICRWGMEGYGTTADLNALPYKLRLEGFPIPQAENSFFTYKESHLFQTWGILLIIAIACLIIARIAISRIRKS